MFCQFEFACKNAQTVRLQFDDVTFNADTRQLWHAGRLVHLSPKAFDLLTLLIERRPQPVPKAAIRERLWPDTFVSETNLPTLVAEIREAIGDDARRPRFLRTLHGFGYAFEAVPHDATGERQPTADQPSGWLVAEGQQIALYAGENVLGREGAGIRVLSSTTVSRRHARIVIGERVVVEDLESKNGTYVNDRRVTSPTPIVDGDRLRTGSLLFTFRLAGPATSTETQSSRGGPTGPVAR